MIRQERLKELLEYDPETGDWIWINAPKHNTRHNGKVAGHLRRDGYRLIRIGGVAYYTGRLAFLYMTGHWPKDEVDHIDRDPSNDKWVNLREATSSDNKCNQTLSPRNTSGFRGISWNGALQKWVAYANTSQLGSFNSIEEAIAARDAAAKQIQGDFAQLNMRSSMT